MTRLARLATIPRTMRVVLRGVGLVEKRVSTTMWAVSPGMRVPCGRVVKKPTTCGRVVESVASSPLMGLSVLGLSLSAVDMAKVVAVAVTNTEGSEGPASVRTVVVMRQSAGCFSSSETGMANRRWLFEVMERVSVPVPSGARRICMPSLPALADLAGTVEKRSVFWGALVTLPQGSVTTRFCGM